MSRYIKLDDIMKYPIRIDHYDEEHGNRHFVLGIESVIEYAEHLPYIDIVRCKECKYYNVYLDKHGCWKRCDLTMVGAEADCFCSWGERKESE